MFKAGNLRFLGNNLRSCCPARTTCDCDECARNVGRLERGLHTIALGPRADSPLDQSVMVLNTSRAAGGVRRGEGTWAYFTTYATIFRRLMQHAKADQVRIMSSRTYHEQHDEYATLVACLAEAEAASVAAEGEELAKAAIETFLARHGRR